MFRFRILLLVAVSILLPVTILEIALQIIDYPQNAKAGWLSEYCQREPKECNQLGFRGKEIRYGNDSYNILLVGDSELEATALKFDDIPERTFEWSLRKQLSAQKKINVFSLGASGYGAGQQLLNLQRFFDSYRCDMVVLWITPRNDVFNVTFPKSISGAIKPTFLLDQDSLVGPNFDFNQKVFSALKIISLMQHISIKNLNEKWEEILPKPYRYNPAFAVGALSIKEAPHQLDFLGRAMLERTSALDVRRERINGQLLLYPVSPRTSYGIKLYRLLIEKMQKMSLGHGAKFLVLKELRPWQKTNQETKYKVNIQASELLLSVGQYWENLDTLLKNTTTIKIDIPYSDYKISKNDNHLNKKSVDFVFQQLAWRIREIADPDKQE